ncbi:hypothetical protein ABD440_00720, partial [Chromobacterium piscinae]|uniref:hypothetical protein n=1 Tax=Chromobacterium piscinae TaxID=686831 RepID=UPI0031FC382D
MPIGLPIGRLAAVSASAPISCVAAKVVVSVRQLVGPPVQFAVAQARLAMTQRFRFRPRRRLRFEQA